MLTHLLVFRSAMTRQMRDLPDTFRATPRDFVQIPDSGSLGTGPNEPGDRREAAPETGGSAGAVPQR